VISAISVSPTRRRVGLYYQRHDHNIRELKEVAFLRHLLRHLRGQVVLIWDNLGVHKGKLVRRLCRRVPRLHFEYLPAYAPELNPDEGVWRHAKRPARHGCPADRFELALSPLDELKALRRSPDRLWSCTAHSGLTL